MRNKIVTGKSDIRFIRRQRRRLRELRSIFNIINHTFYGGKMKLKRIELYYEKLTLNGEDMGGIFSIGLQRIMIDCSYEPFPEVLDIFIHELAHLIDYHLYPKRKPIGADGHDDVFDKINLELRELVRCYIYQNKKDAFLYF